MVIINTEVDFLRALSEHPEWRAAVRAQILGEELLQLPVQFQVFVQQQQQFNAEMQGFVAEQREQNGRSEAHMDRIDTRMDRIDTRMDRIDTRMDRIEGDISVVKGGHARNRGIESAPAIADDLGLEYVRTISRAELVSISRGLTDSAITTGDRRSFRDADLIIEAAAGATTVYVAAEISYTADLRDSERAERNARYLSQHMNLPTYAAVASVRNDYALQQLIDAGKIHWHQLTERDLQTA